eukprot:647171-Karenia_brevis.AAC.1
MTRFTCTCHTHTNLQPHTTQHTQARDDDDDDDDAGDDGNDDDDDHHTGNPAQKHGIPHTTRNKMTIGKVLKTKSQLVVAGWRVHWSMEVSRGLDQICQCKPPRVVQLGP